MLCKMPGLVSAITSDNLIWLADIAFSYTICVLMLENRAGICYSQVIICDICHFIILILSNYIKARIVKIEMNAGEH